MTQSIPKIRSDIENTKEQISETVHELQERLEEIKSDLDDRKTHITDTVHGVEERIEKVKVMTAKAREYPIQKVQEYPLQSVLVSVGIGMLFSSSLAPVLKNLRQYAQPALKSYLSGLLIHKVQNNLASR